MFLERDLARRLAVLVLETSKVREESYDHAASNAASERAARERNENPHCAYAGYVDYNKFYRLSIHDACVQVCPPELVTPVFILVESGYQDMFDWANGVLGNKGNAAPSTNGDEVPGIEES